jgi:hypothetical protein
MGTCEVCGNDYEKAFTVISEDGERHVFDSFECAIHALAPACENCGIQIIGHGMGRNGEVYCCQHCLDEGSADESDTVDEFLQPEETGWSADRQAREEPDIVDSSFADNSERKSI